MMLDFADLCESRRRIEAAYDPELLRAAGRRLVDMLADHLGQRPSLGRRRPAVARAGGKRARRRQRLSISPSDRMPAARRSPIALPGSCRPC